MSASRHIREVVTQAERRLDFVLAEAAQKACEYARVLTGTRYFTPQQLARMGHPYARRRPRPPLPEYLVSRQSGEFHAGWVVEGLELGHYRVANYSSRASLVLGGTRETVARPVLERVFQLTLDELRVEGPQALRDALESA